MSHRRCCGWLWCVRWYYVGAGEDRRRCGLLYGLVPRVGGNGVCYWAGCYYTGWRSCRGVKFREELDCWGRSPFENDLGDGVALADDMSSLPPVDDEDRSFTGRRRINYPGFNVDVQGRGGTWERRYAAIEAWRDGKSESERDNLAGLRRDMGSHGCE